MAKLPEEVPEYSEDYNDSEHVKQSVIEGAKQAENGEVIKCGAWLAIPISNDNIEVFKIDEVIEHED